MLPGFVAYIVAIGMLAVCGCVALMLVRTVHHFDGDQRDVDATSAPPVTHADAA